MKKIGFVLLTLAVIFVFAETVYFGNNLLPETNAEKICDGIALLIGIIGGTLYLFSKTDAGDEHGRYKK